MVPGIFRLIVLVGFFFPFLKIPAKMIASQNYLSWVVNILDTKFLIHLYFQIVYVMTFTLPLGGVKAVLCAD